MTVTAAVNDGAVAADTTVTLSYGAGGTAAVAGTHNTVSFVDAGETPTAVHQVTGATAQLGSEGGEIDVSWTAPTGGTTPTGYEGRLAAVGLWRGVHDC